MPIAPDLTQNRQKRHGRSRVDPIRPTGEGIIEKNSWSEGETINGPLVPIIAILGVTAPSGVGFLFRLLR